MRSMQEVRSTIHASLARSLTLDTETYRNEKLELSDWTARNGSTDDDDEEESEESDDE